MVRLALLASSIPLQAAITGSGFPAGALVAVKAGPGDETRVAADAAGAFTATVRTREVLFGTTREDAVTARTADGSASASAALRVQRPVPGIEPGARRPTLPVRIAGAGYPSGRIVYAHLRRNGRTVTTCRVGVAAGPCGLVRGRARDLLVPPGGRIPGSSRAHSVRIAAAKVLKASTRPTGVGQPRWLEGGS